MQTINAITKVIRSATSNPTAVIKFVAATHAIAHVAFWSGVFQGSYGEQLKQVRSALEEEIEKQLCVLKR